jgi:hypothetical protein
MLRLGCPSPEAREMDIDDIFSARLRLLIIMARAYLDGCPLGEFRRQAMLENARHVESECVDIGGLTAGYAQEEIVVESGDIDHVFYQRIKLLAVMVKAIAKGFPMGEHRKTAMHENLELICQTLGYEAATPFPLFKVA